MPKIPPPIMSLLKIQLIHLIKDKHQDLAFKLALVMLVIEKAPEVIEAISKTTIEGDDKDPKKENDPNRTPSLSRKIKKALATASNAGKIALVDGTLVGLAKLVDTMNEAAYNLVEPGFQLMQINKGKIKVNGKEVDADQYWFSESDREIKSIDQAKYFKSSGVEFYSGNLSDTKSVNAHCNKMLQLANPLDILIQIGMAIWRIITKIRIFISRLYDLTIKLAVRISKTAMQVGQDSAEWISSFFQTTASVGVGASVSVTTV